MLQALSAFFEDETETAMAHRQARDEQSGHVIKAKTSSTLPIHIH
jgi:hypothetical protein